MSITWISIACVAFTILSVIFSWIVLHKKSPSGSPALPWPDLPPGDLGLPLLGDTLSYVNAYCNMGLKSYFEKKRAKYGSVFRTSIMGQPTIFMDSPDGCKFLFTQRQLIQGYWPASVFKIFGSRGLSGKKGEEHRLVRYFLASNVLGPNVVPRYIETVESMAVEHLQTKWLVNEDGAEVKVNDLMKNFFFSVICKRFLSITNPEEIERNQQHFDVLNRGLVALPVDFPGFFYHRAIQARKRIIDILNPYLLKRKQELIDGTASPDQDLLSIFLTRPDENGRYHEKQEIIDSVIELVAGGSDTMATTLTNVIREIGRHPTVYENVIREHAEISSRKAEGESLSKEDIQSMKYTWQVVQEAIRLTPVVPVIFREAKKTFKYKDFTIPEGWKLCSPEARFSNPEAFKNSEEFIPSRWEQSGGGAALYSCNVFGGGDRRCPGSDFSKMIHMLVTLHQFLKHIKWTLVKPGEKIVWGLTPLFT